MITSLDPARNFCGEYETIVVNAHGCGVIVRELLEKETPVMVELVSNGRSKKGRIVLVISLVEGTSWLLGLEFDNPAGDFWEIENPPVDWRDTFVSYHHVPKAECAEPFGTASTTLHFH